MPQLWLCGKLKLNHLLLQGLVLQTYPSYSSFELPIQGNPQRGSVSAVPQISFLDNDLRGFVGGQTTPFGLVFTGFLLLDTPPPPPPATCSRSTNSGCAPAVLAPSFTSTARTLWTTAIRHATTAKPAATMRLVLT